MGSIRTGVGVSLVAAPAWAGRIWVGPDADGHGARVFARALGARDVALGAAILAASAGGDDQRVVHLVRLGAAADAADMVATLFAWRNLEGRRRWLMPVIAVGVGAAGAIVASKVAGSAVGDDATDPTGDTGIVDPQGAMLAEMADDVEAVRGNGVVRSSSVGPA